MSAYVRAKRQADRLRQEANIACIKLKRKNRIIIRENQEIKLRLAEKLSENENLMRENCHLQSELSLLRSNRSAVNVASIEEEDKENAYFGNGLRCGVTTRRKRGSGDDVEKRVAFHDSRLAQEHIYEFGPDEDRTGKSINSQSSHEGFEIEDKTNPLNSAMFDLDESDPDQSFEMVSRRESVHPGKRTPLQVLEEADIVPQMEDCSLEIEQYCDGLETIQEEDEQQDRSMTVCGIMEFSSSEDNSTPEKTIQEMEDHKRANAPVKTSCSDPLQTTPIALQHASSTNTTQPTDLPTDLYVPNTPNTLASSDPSLETASTLPSYTSPSPVKPERKIKSPVVINVRKPLTPKNTNSVVAGKRGGKSGKKTGKGKATENGFEELGASKEIIRKFKTPEDAGMKEALRLIEENGLNTPPPRRMRRTVKAVNYTEPSLGAKLRSDEVKSKKKKGANGKGAKAKTTVKPTKSRAKATKPSLVDADHSRNETIGYEKTDFTAAGPNYRFKQEAEV